jgi:hypothetical protein
MAEEGGGASRSTDPAAGTSSATDVSLREYFHALMDSDRSHGRERFYWLIGLGGIIWFEIQRRLENLNHENARILAAQETSISKDTYDANEEQRKAEQANLESWRKEVDKDRTTSISRDEFQQDSRAQKRSTLDSRTAIIGVGVSLLVAVVFLLTYVAARHTSAPTPTPIVTVTIPTK